MDYTCWKHYWFSFKLLIFLKKVWPWGQLPVGTEHNGDEKRGVGQSKHLSLPIVSCGLFHVSIRHSKSWISTFLPKSSPSAKLPASLNSLAFYEIWQCHSVLLVKTCKVLWSQAAIFSWIWKKEISNYKVFFLPKITCRHHYFALWWKRVILILCSR